MTRNTSSLRIFFQHTTMWWRSSEKKLAWTGLIGIVLTSFISVYISVCFTEWSKIFYDAIEQKDLDGFIRQVLWFIPLVVLLLTDFCGRNYLNAWFSFRWRRWITESLRTKWLSYRNFYTIAQKVPNPDQRIAADAQQVAYLSIQLFSAFFRDGINFVTFSIILWNLSSKIPLKWSGHSFTIPGFLVWAAILYSLIGIIITFKIGRPLVMLNQKQEQYEADFRYRLMRIFEHREEIATINGESQEQKGLDASFLTLTSNYYDILKRAVYLNLFQNFYLNSGMFVPLFVVGPAYFAGLISMGLLMQIRAMFAEVSQSLSAISLSFQNIASWIASLQRLILFQENLINEQYNTQSHNILKITNLTILHEDNKTLWNVPDIILKPGSRTVIMAPSGRGKTSLIRIMAGLSKRYKKHSSMELHIPDKMMFIPQRPYMPLGTLRQCISYPAATYEEDDILEVMNKCRLGHLVQWLDQVQDYQNILSLGEQQRVNFARVLLYSPTWLMMDEPIAHLNEEYAEILSMLCIQNLHNSGILVTSHKPLPYFQLVTW